MTGEMLRAAGRNTIVAGNIGLPVLDALDAIEAGDPLPDAFVLELSSFQLETTREPRCRCGDRAQRDRRSSRSLRRHRRLRRGEGAHIRRRWRTDPESRRHAQHEHGAFWARMSSRSAWTRHRAAEHWGIRGGSMLARGARELLPVGELPVAGLHNAANALAALALGETRWDCRSTRCCPGCCVFEGLPHRLQKVAEIRGVTFYDDSKGTNVGATVAALNGMSVPVVLIAGGDGKGQDFSPLRARDRRTCARCRAHRPRRGCHRTGARGRARSTSCVPRPWKKRSSAHSPPAAAEMQCCSRLRVRATTCSEATCIAARFSSRPCERIEKREGAS